MRCLPTSGQSGSFNKSYFSHLIWIHFIQMIKLNVFHANKILCSEPILDSSCSRNSYLWKNGDLGAYWIVLGQSGPQLPHWGVKGCPRK